MADPLAVDIREGARRLYLNPATVRKLIAEGELSAIRIGRQTIIPVAELERFLRDKMPLVGPRDEQELPQEVASEVTA